jgi:hypothetical protein
MDHQYSDQYYKILLALDSAYDSLNIERTPKFKEYINQVAIQKNSPLLEDIFTQLITPSWFSGPVFQPTIAYYDDLCYLCDAINTSCNCLPWIYPFVLDLTINDFHYAPLYSPLNIVRPVINVTIQQGNLEAQYKEKIVPKDSVKIITNPIDEHIFDDAKITLESIQEQLVHYDSIPNFLDRFDEIMNIIKNLNKLVVKSGTSTFVIPDIIAKRIAQNYAELLSDFLKIIIKLNDTKKATENNNKAKQEIIDKERAHIKQIYTLLYDNVKDVMGDIGEVSEDKYGVIEHNIIKKMYDSKIEIGKLSKNLRKCNKALSICNTEMEKYRKLFKNCDDKLKEKEKDCNNSLETLYRGYDDLRKQLLACEGTIEKKSKEYEEKLKEKNQEYEDLREYDEEELGRVKGRKMYYKGEFEKANGELEEAKKNLELKEQELNNMKVRHKATKDKLVTERNDKVQTLREKDEIAKKVDEQMKKILAQDEELYKLTMDRDRLKEHLEDAEKLKSKGIGDLLPPTEEESAEDLKKKIKVLERRIEELKDEMVDEIDKATKNNSILDELNRQLGNKIKQLENELGALREEHSRCLKKVKELEAMNKQRNDDMDKLRKRTESMRETLEGEIKDLRIKQDKYKNELRTCRSKFQEMEVLLVDTKAKRDELLLDVEKNKSKILAINREVVKLEGDLVVKQEEIDRIEEYTRQIDAQLKKCKEDLEKARQEIKDKSKIIRDNQELIEEKDKEVRDYQKLLSAQMDVSKVWMNKVKIMESYLFPIFEDAGIELPYDDMQLELAIKSLGKEYGNLKKPIVAIDVLLQKLIDNNTIYMQMFTDMAKLSEEIRDSQSFTKIINSITSSSHGNKASAEQFSKNYFILFKLLLLLANLAYINTQKKDELFDALKTMAEMAQEKSREIFILVYPKDNPLTQAVDILFVLFTTQKYNYVKFLYTFIKKNNPQTTNVGVILDILKGLRISIEREEKLARDTMVKLKGDSTIQEIVGRMQTFVNMMDDFGNI